MARQFPIYRYFNRSPISRVRTPKHKHVFQRGDVDRMVDHIIGKTKLRPQWQVILSPSKLPNVTLSDLMLRINTFYQLNTENYYEQDTESYVRTGIGTTEMYLSPTGLEYIPGNSKVAAVLIKYKGNSDYFKGGRSMISGEPRWHVDYGNNRILFWNTRGIALNRNITLIRNAGQNRPFVVTGAQACDWTGNMKAILYSSPYRNIWGHVPMHSYTKKLLYGKTGDPSGTTITPMPEMNRRWESIQTKWINLSAGDFL